jgi:putative phosphoribosyl transferase
MDDGSSLRERAVRIPAGRVVLDGDLALPDAPVGVVLFAHGSGSGRRSPRNRHVAGRFRERGLATLLVDLLSAEEQAEDARTAHLRFDIRMLADRLVWITRWLEGPDAGTAGLPIGYFGASTGGGAALVAAAEVPDLVRAIVSRGGRPDLAGEALPRVRAPTLLIVGEKDVPVIGMNQEAMAGMRGEVVLEIVPGASHLFEEPGTLEQAARLARDWFLHHLPRGPGRAGDGADTFRQGAGSGAQPHGQGRRSDG